MADKGTKNRTIVLFIEEDYYAEFISNRAKARMFLDQTYAQHPELFPDKFGERYVLYGTTKESKKTNLCMRRIEVAGVIYQIQPSFVLSFMRGYTDEVSDALFLIRFGVPFWALAKVFGKNQMYWYRMYINLGQNSLVGTTVRSAENLPLDLVVDEQHIRIEKKQKAYVATTTAQGCILGAEVCESASEASLQKGYGVFKEEVLDVAPDYQPNTANTDGWAATQTAWKVLFPMITIIECFLHAFLKVRDRATKKMQDSFLLVADKIWECYRAESKRQMSQRIRRVYEWTNKNILACPMKDNVLKLCKKKDLWLKHFDFPDAHRTSNHLDRLMKFMKKHFVNSQKFHGPVKTTTKNYRAFALLCNFTPSCPEVTKKTPNLTSPAARLNGFVYHEKWLHNLLISTSLGGYRHQQNPL